MIRVLKAITVFSSAVIATGSVWVLGSTAFFPWTKINAYTGEKLFRARCASCHAIDPKAGTSFGPNLADIGTDAAKRLANLSAEEYLLQSIVDPAAFRPPGTTGVMPANIAGDYDSIEIMSLVGYLKTLGSKVDGTRLVELQPQAVPLQADVELKLDFARAQRGKKLFFGKGQCGTCHRLRDLPGNALAAPNLLRAGEHSKKHIRESILNPTQDLTSGYKLVQVLLLSGKVIVGQLISHTDAEIEVLVSSSEHVTLEKISRSEIDIEDGSGIYETSLSSMPSNYEKLLSEEEIDALVHFLETLPR